MKQFWKLAIYILAALATSELSHEANATSSFKLSTKQLQISNIVTLNNTATPTPKTLKVQALTASATPPQTGSRYLLGTEDRHSNEPLTDTEVVSSSVQHVPQVAQAQMLSDVQGHWAERFIQPLAEQGIIRGFPDGTFRPDQPVTRAQFAAMLQKAFQKNAIRNPVQFADVPASYWAYDAIEAAYSRGFLAGYPNSVFNPSQNIPRVQALVSLAEGLNLAATTVTPAALDTYFQDAAQIPDYARDQVAGATENRIVVNYPDTKVLNPNRVASRADVAAFIYQSLVSAGTAPQLTASESATQYIVGYKPPATTTPPTTTQTPQTVEDLRQSFRIEPPPFREIAVGLGAVSAPGSTVGSPTAFGADFGNVFIGGEYQARARFSHQDDGGAVVGFGLGKREIVGLEVAVSSFSTFRQGFFTNGGVSFKLHHLFNNNLAVAVGLEDVIQFGRPDAQSSVYGVVSKIFELKRSTTKPFSAIAVSVGVGGGRFRSEYEFRRGIDTVNVFGSVGIRVLEPLAIIADWTGQDLTVGASIAPFRRIPIIITPAFADITGNAGDGARFILGVGYGFFFQ